MAELIKCTDGTYAQKALRPIEGCTCTICVETEPYTTATTTEQGRQLPAAMYGRAVAEVDEALSWAAAESRDPTMASADLVTYYLGSVVENLTPLDWGRASGRALGSQRLWW